MDELVKLYFRLRLETRTFRFPTSLLKYVSRKKVVPSPLVFGLCVRHLHNVVENDDGYGS